MEQNQNKCPVVTVIMSVPGDSWTALYENNVGFGRGTILSQLDKPFLGRFFDKDKRNTWCAKDLYSRFCEKDEEETKE